MNQLTFPELKEEKRKLKKERGLILTERDLNIIEFILDMKFATVQDVFEKFFKITLAGQNSKSLHAAIKRLQRLAKSGYLKSVHSFSERRKYYLGTWKGYYAVERSYPEKEICKPSRDLDHHTFEHDKKVLEARIILENRRAAMSWLSDRKLRTNKELAGGLLLSNVPDGLFKSAEGLRVALEVEASTKTQAVYKAKIKKYVSMLRSEEAKVNVFDRVLYVVAKPWVREFLLKETKIYGDLFEIQSFEEFFGRKVSEPQSENSLK